MKAEDLENNKEQKWENVNDFLAKNGSHVNILEEEIDVEVQHEFIQLFEVMSKDAKEFKEMAEKAPSCVSELYDNSIDEARKKRLLIFLATINEIAIYRQIEAFQKEDTPLKKWATVALQQSRMVIQSSLLDESTVFVSTGLGGHGSLLRYFCVYVANEGVMLQPFQWDIVTKETELMVTQAKGKVEQYEYFEKYLTFTLMLPIDANLKGIFEPVINECNTYGNFLRENLIITNVKKLTPKEIDAFLASHSQKRGQ